MKIVLYLMILTLSCHVSYSFPKTKIFGSFHQRRNLLLMTLNQPSNFKPLHSFRKILSTTLISSSANVIPTAAIFDIKPKSSIETVATNTRLKIKNSIQDKLKGMQGQSEERQRASVSGHAIAATTTRGSSFVRDAVRSVGPSVVRIDCEKEISSMMALLAPESPLKEGDVVKISGSGFVVTEDGYILTNAHVVQSTRRITVTFSNGRTFKATLVACDELTDLAVLRAETGETKLTKAPLGDSSRLQSGDWLIAVGCPVGLDFTVTLGIVSSPHRSAAEVGASHLKGTYIQTDAALNSGNSGGLSFHS